MKKSTTTRLEQPVRDLWLLGAYQGFGVCASCPALEYLSGVNPESRICIECFEHAFKMAFPNMRRRRPVAATNQAGREPENGDDPTMNTTTKKRAAARSGAKSAAAKTTPAPAVAETAGAATATKSAEPVVQLPERDEIAPAPDAQAMMKTLLAQVKKTAKTVEVQEPKSEQSHYLRLRKGTTTIAYLFESKLGLKVDLYAGDGITLPAFVAPGRGRARKEGMIAVVTTPEQATEVAAAIAAIAKAS